MSILFMFMVSLSILFLWLKHPLSMGFVLICQTLIIAMLAGMSLSSFLLSYIIVIIMMSGALVLFIYMASVASNEKFQTPLTLIMLFILINLITFIMQDKTDEMSGYINNFLNMKPEDLMLIKMFNSSSGFITVAMIIYLLLTMIVVSNIASSSEGPLRKKM
uniref:NADH dehydrogenase subunit 6 n=1 Tax=Eusthenes cupreus TaxID=1392985 RepID=T1QDP2_9HEMI|nr:NADH dehydrogenase subunit 6 [Eusthenes cupreus]AFY16816.1 NADH dehydrogenase subunit 6 [Eusthenes cupreus]